MELCVSGTSVGVLKNRTNQTVYAILAAICFCHFLNDMTQSMISACYPIFKDLYHLDYSQVGLITLTYQMIASLLQPVVGFYTDRRPQPFSLPVGMGFTLVGLVLLSRAYSFHMILFSVGLVGVGSSVFHPESSRVARMASGGQHGLAQSFFQVGGNTGSALGPLLAAFLVLPRGQHSIAWFSIAVLVAIMVLTYVGGWYHSHRSAKAASLVKQRSSNRRCRQEKPCGDPDPVEPALLEVLLSFQPLQLLHFLPDQQISSLGAERADSSVRFPGSGRAGNLCRRSNRRPHRPQVCHLVLDPRGASRSRWRCPTRIFSGPAFSPCALA